MKKLLVMTLALGAVGFTACGDDSKDGEEKEMSQEAKIAKIACGCAEEALQVVDDPANANEEEATELRSAYMQCAIKHKEELQNVKGVNQEDMEAEMKKQCPDAAAVMKKLKG